MQVLCSRHAVCEVAGFGGAAPCEIRPPSWEPAKAAAVKRSGYVDRLLAYHSVLKNFVHASSLREPSVYTFRYRLLYISSHWHRPSCRCTARCTQDPVYTAYPPPGDLAAVHRILCTRQARRPGASCALYTGSCVQGLAKIHGHQI